MAKKPGRPLGVTCKHNPDTKRDAYGCRKAARVKITMNANGQTFVTFRCWKHYVMFENAKRHVPDGMGNIIHAEEIL